MQTKPLHAQLQMKAQLPLLNIKSQPITKTSEKKTKTSSSQQHHPKLPLRIHLQTKPIQEEQGIFTDLDKKTYKAYCTLLDGIEKRISGDILVSFQQIRLSIDQINKKQSNAKTIHPKHLG